MRYLSFRIVLMRLSLTFLADSVLEGGQDGSQPKQSVTLTSPIREGSGKEKSCVSSHTVAGDSNNQKATVQPKLEVNPHRRPYL